MIARLFFFASLPLLLLACKEDVSTELPKPAKLTAEAVSHYCQMSVLVHPGPKAQVHLEGHLYPLFFAQVRDAIAFQKMPEKVARVAVTYVSDMGKAESWSALGDNWIAAKNALYVIGSKKTGGMGAPELVPFAFQKDAEQFVRQYWGKVIGYSGITNEMVLSPVEIKLPRQVDTDSQSHLGSPDDGNG